MPQTILKPRLHFNKVKQENKPPFKIQHQHYLQIYKNLNKNYYQEMVL